MNDILQQKPHLVKVIHQFDSEFSDELNSSVNDFIQIESKLDKYWFYGHSNGRSGKIPVSNCREVVISADRVADNQCLFAAINDFVNDCIDGDLRLRRGDLIIGFGPVDENWWNGCLYENPLTIGIFPLTHVWRLDSNLLPKSVKPSEQTNETMFGKVVVEMRSQLDNEIDLFKDEIIKITDNYDKMYFKGESMDGQRKGIFPKNFVKVLEDYQPIDAQTSEQSVMNCQQLVDNYLNDSFEEIGNDPLGADLGLDNPPSYEHVINQSLTNGAAAQPSSLGYSNTYIGDVQSYGRAMYTFKAEFPNELSLKENEIVHLIRHLDNEWIEGEIDGRIGIFPKAFVEIIVDCDLNSISLTDGMDNRVFEEFPNDTFGRVLYDFDGEIEGDLKVRNGDTLTLIRKIDNNWLEVMDDSGNIGLIPNNYCEIIDDISSIHSRTASTIDDNTIESIHSNGDSHHYYPNIFSLTDEPPEHIPVTEHSDIVPVIIQQTEPAVSDTDNGYENTLKVCNNSVNEPKLSPKIPRRPAPGVPKPSINQQQVSPHRPPPPVPKHKRIKNLSKCNDSTDTFNRQESIRSSIASNSSSGSGKSDTTATVTPVSPEDRNRVDERKKKVREQRSCIITELLQTERDYKLNLVVCADIFLRKPEEARNHGIDLDRLFGNLDEIIGVSKRLIQLLEESTLMKTYDKQRVGKCFLEITDQMKSAYSTYCRNHDLIQPLFNKYEANADSKQYLQKGLAVMQEQTNCFDIPSVLIKPVQRILKYPLLLNELHKCTEEGHEDKPDLILAIDQITSMATNINEFKRRQDLVHKYRREGSYTLSSRLSKINLHTVMKKSSRLGHRITSTLGLTSTTKDDEFDREVRKLRTVEKTIKIFVKDKQGYMKSAQDFINQGLGLVEVIAEYYDKKNKQQEVEQLRTTHRVIVSQYWTEFTNAVDRDVTPVLDKLLQKFSGPNKLIAKRFDKLTDYDSVNKKLECNKDGTRLRGLQEQQQMARNVYEALNSQLREELPKLCDISMEILNDCIQAFLIARKKLIGRIAKHHLSLLELPLVMGFTTNSAEDIIETFQIKHNLITEQLVSEISVMSNSVFPNACASGPNGYQTDFSRKHSTRGSRKSMQLNNVSVSVVNSIGVNNNRNQNVRQSPSQRAYLQSRYKSHHLYEAVKSYEAIDVLDMYLNKGDLVGVIKKQDPMGGHHRWFVDTGSAQGFVLSNILIPHHDDSWVTPPKTSDSTKLHTISEKNALNFSSNFSPNPNPSSPLPQHQYKLHPTPETPVQLRNEVETHRYEEVEDSPPRYSRLDISNNSVNNLLSFDESIDEKQLQTQHSYNFGEFDPYAPVAMAESMSSMIAVDHRYEEVPEESPTPMASTPQRQLSTQPVPENELYFAAYPFKASDRNQLNLEFGQSVTVNYKCDMNGNKEWWFVIDREGRSGYVPANYLQKYQSK